MKQPLILPLVIFRTLLDQPSFERGELPAVSVDVLSILAAAVERNCELRHAALLLQPPRLIATADFSSRQIPPQEWSRESPDVGVDFNSVPPLRSLLAWPWGRANSYSAKRARSLQLERMDHGTGPRGVRGFTSWAAQEETDQAQTDEPRSSAVYVPPLRSSIEPSTHAGADGLGRVELVRLRNVSEGKADQFMASYIRRLYERERRYQNVGGDKPAEPTEVAFKIVEALGPQSRSGECSMRRLALIFY